MTKRPDWPGSTANPDTHHPIDPRHSKGEKLRIQFIPCDVGRGLNLKGQFQLLRKVIEASPSSSEITLRSEFDVTEINLFEKLNTFKPHVVHISGNQNGGDVLFPAAAGGEIVVSDQALAGLLRSLGSTVRLAIIDTCASAKCATSVAHSVDFGMGVPGYIHDEEAIRFYEIFYQAAARDIRWPMRTVRRKPLCDFSMSL